MQSSTYVTRSAPETVTVLSVSPIPEDHLALERILRGLPPAAGGESGWRLCRAATLSSALAILTHAPCPVALCERDLPLGDWKDLLEHSRRLVNPPFIVVTARTADECLWAEALNLGAYDVLAKPFDPVEVTRIVALACLRWRRDRPLTPSPLWV